MRHPHTCPPQPNAPDNSCVLMHACVQVVFAGAMCYVQHECACISRCVHATWQTSTKRIACCHCNECLTVVTHCHALDTHSMHAPTRMTRYCVIAEQQRLQQHEEHPRLTTHTCCMHKVVGSAEPDEHARLPWTQPAMHNERGRLLCFPGLVVLRNTILGAGGAAGCVRRCGCVSR